MARLACREPDLKTVPDDLLNSLSRSKAFAEYEQAFTGATGLPVSLDPPEPWALPHQGKAQNEFCEIMARVNRTCAACLRAQGQLKERAIDHPAHVECEMEMIDSAVSVKLGPEVIAFIQTGQVFCAPPTAAQFARVAERLRSWGVAVTPQIESAYFRTPVMSPEQYESMVRLLAIFAEQLSGLANQIALQNENAEPPVVRRAKDYIHSHQDEAVTLEHVARASSTSTFHFCKMFKRATGLTFTDYLSRVRIEKAKHLLADPQRRVSEVAFAVGFQSLTHFNRVFRKVVGSSPTQFRGAVTERTAFARR